MSSNKSSRDRTKDRDRDRDRDRSVKKEKERKDRKSTRDRDREKESAKSTRERETEKESDKNSRRLERRDKPREKEESDRRRSKVRGEKEEGERRKSSGRLQDKTEKHRDEARSSTKVDKNKKPIESRHLIEDLIDEDGDLVESEISEENIKPPSRINQIQSAKIKEDKNPTENEDEFNYEDDDFEEYDEDFEDEEEEEEEEEEDDSEDTEEDDNGAVERKLDSGNYDMQTSKQSALRAQAELAAVKEAMRRENSGVGSPARKPAASDLESPASPAARQERKQSGFINFSAAKERNKVQLAAAAATSRGSELLQMIRLDIVTFDLLDLPPIRLV